MHLKCICLVLFLILGKSKIRRKDAILLKPKFFTYYQLLYYLFHIKKNPVWDNMQYVQFKWVHYEVSTLLPYNDEIMFENSLMLNQTGNVQLSSMIHIFKSLTQNAKNIFLIMVQAVLNPSNAKKSKLFFNFSNKNLCFLK